MSKTRQFQNLSKFETFGEPVEVVINSSQECSSQNTHLIFDSYIELSVKAGERIRQSSGVSSIDLAEIYSTVPIPKQINKFWTSGQNKQNLQLLAREVALSSRDNIVVNAIIVDQDIVSAQLKQNNSLNDIPLLNS